MLSTAEVRWFHAGKIPAKLRSWFRKLAATAEPQRIDHYLLERDTDAVGIKFREGRVEVKQRQGERRLISLGPGWDGYVESWSKWGFPLADAQRRGKAFESFDNWIAVQKKRRVITYRISPKGKLIALPGDAGGEYGCSVELTQVRVMKTLWWTLGFEAKGHPESLESTLEQVARAVLSGSAPPTFEPTDSFSYPGWLQVWSKHAGALK
ncbi:MAG: hypothetical protein MUQ30_17320 [Anaerolineae bacterium]|nr:hypothetical protein [Anaerolineae bacterium]